MKTDRELLELAAKACGMTTSEALSKLGKPINLYSQWNPLEDDGDALRLAVQLGIEVFPDITFGEVTTAFMVSDVIGLDTYEDFGDDPMAATRRAIVRAAAEIGERK